MQVAYTALHLQQHADRECDEKEHFIEESQCCQHLNLAPCCQQLPVVEELS